MEEEIVLISAYTPTKEKVTLLRNLVSKLKEFKYKIAVCTHSITPQDIIEECDYFFYDKENKLNYDLDIKYNHYFNAAGFKFKFKGGYNPSTHIYPIIKMVYPSIKYLQGLGYKKLHHLEYDTILTGNDSLKTHSLLLDSYDIVGYNENPEKNYILGGFKSYNMLNVNFNKIPTDENTLISLYRSYYQNQQFPVTEKIVFDLLFSKNNIKFLNPNSLININTQLSTNSEYNVFWNFHLHEGKFRLIYRNTTKKNKLIEVIINEKKYKNDIPPGHWKWFKFPQDPNTIIAHLYIDKNFTHMINMNNPDDRKNIEKYGKVIKIK